jgi:hypothetical protein
VVHGQRQHTLSGATLAVFVSYASRGARAAGRVCEALRASGFEVWFDKSELRGGDAWYQKIRPQIRDCTLFLPIISRSTQVRAEGYFRLEQPAAGAAADPPHGVGRGPAEPSSPRDSAR